MDNFKYIKNIKNGVGEIRVYDSIGIQNKSGIERGVSGSVFASEMAHLKTVCDKINIRFNSDGGSVLDGYAIFSSIINAGVETESFIDGVAASTAGWCAMAADKCSIMDYATLMVHGASGSDDTELISMVNSSIAKMLSNRSGMSEEDANKLMSKETWYSASNANDKKFLLENKFVDEVIKTDKKVKINKADFKNLSIIYNKIINTDEMSTKSNTLLKLANDASESEREAAIATLNKELTDSKTELETLKNKLKTIEDAQAAKDLAEAEALKTEVTEFVNKAVKDGLIEKEVIEETILNASKDRKTFAFISNLISKNPNNKNSKKPFDFKNVNGEDGEDRSKWNYKEWEKKDLNGLVNMRANEPEQFNELLKTLK